MSGPTTTASRDPFQRVSELMYRISGVNLTDGKRELVRARVAKRMRALGMSSMDGYVRLVEGDDGAAELRHMVDVLTTNKTSFFRERPHFDYLQRVVLPAWLKAGGPLRIWSAGCSSGEEPYSVAMLLNEVVSDVARRDVKILATDLSRPVLEKAQEGIYDASPIREVPPALRERYFTAVPAQGGVNRYQVSSALRTLISFAPLNLMGPWPMKGPFDLIMCRNVMIYFDRPTREELVRRFRLLLKPGGTLMVGHSESLSGLKHDMKYVQPAVYNP